MTSNINRKSLLKIIFFSFFIFISLEILFLGFISYLKVNTLEIYVKEYTRNIQNNIRHSQENVSKYATIFFQNSINKKDIIDIIEEASKTEDNQELKKLREKLYKELLPTYKVLKNIGLKHLHFYLPDTTSFLRFNMPLKFGDKLKTLRETVNYVTKHKAPIFSFEGGRIDYSFRNVFPLFKDNIFIGAVELSSTFKEIKKNFLNTYKNSLVLIIKKDVIEKKVFKEFTVNYKKSEYKSYLYNVNYREKDDMQLSLKEISKINKKIEKIVQSRLKEGIPFSIPYDDKKHYHIISFVPIDNIDGKAVAFTIHYSFSSFLKQAEENYYLHILLFTLSNILLCIFIGATIFRQRLKMIKAKQISVLDSLTSIYNRLGIDAKFEEELERHKRYGLETAIIFFDIDHFKKINDNYGHQVGDRILAGLAELVSQSLRKTDILGRWGGEEFIIILPNTDLKKAIEVAEKLRKKIEKNNFFQIDSLTCSFGVTSFLKNDNYDSIINRVDALMYKAKTEGRNRVAFST